MKIQSVSPEDVEYESIAKVANQRKRNKIDYAVLEERYNALKVTGFLLVEVDRSLKVGNVVVVLNNRGLVRDEDYEIVKLSRDSNGKRIAADVRPLIITKLTPRLMTSR